MMFGETFGDEIRAAGLGGLPFIWDSGGFIGGRENLTAAENATLDAVIAAHDPAATIPPLTRRQRIVERLRADPVLKAQVIDGFEARGITDKNAMLDRLEAKYGDPI